MPLARRALRAACAALLLVAPGRPALAAAAPVPADSPAATPAASSATVLDVVLPSGLRVLLARDLTLPVAAVTLAVETGSEDDPPEFPGLVHALAYHLHQGNRELRPGEAIAAVQDAGGVQGLATGPGQVRFESLVPVSRLDQVLYVESQRLRSPTIDRGRWEISLGWAASDEHLPSRLRPEARAALFGAPSLGHDGRVVSKSLGGMVLPAIAGHLSGKFSYNRATLIVVSPEEPEALLGRIRPLFADLPATGRNLPQRQPPPPRSAAAEPVPLSVVLGAPAPAASGKPAETPATPAASEPAAGKTAEAPRRPTAFAWPIAPNSAANAWAGAICRALNRQKREDAEPRKVRVLCDLEADNRRGALLVRVVGAEDAGAVLRGRLARLAGADSGLLATQVAIVTQVVRLSARTPVGLARLLAASSARPSGPVPVDSPVARDLEEMTGLAALADRNRPALELGALRLEDALGLAAQQEATP